MNDIKPGPCPRQVQFSPRTFEFQEISDCVPPLVRTSGNFVCCLPHSCSGNKESNVAVTENAGNFVCCLPHSCSWNKESNVAVTENVCEFRLLPTSLMLVEQGEQRSGD